MTTRRTFRSRRRSKRRGAAALEFAIVVVIFLITVLGIVELSRALMVHQVLINGAREGARRAVVPGATDADLTAIVANYLQSAGIPSSYTVATYVNGASGPVSGASSQDRLTVAVSIPFSNVSWGIMRFMPANATLGAAVVMRKE